MWGTNGPGWSKEVVVEVIMRSAVGKRTVERSLEGWGRDGVCALEALEGLKHVWSRRAVGVSVFGLGGHCWI